jgi:hypothetical protein
LSDGDNRIRELKNEISDRAAVEHNWGPLGSGDDNGLHYLGSARCFVSNVAPTDLAQLGGYNGTDHTVGTLLSATEPSGTIDQGAGRCWIDLDGADDTAGTLDDYSIYGWNETTNAFQLLSAGYRISDTSFLYNGSFEVTDGTGDVAATATPAGWLLSGTPTIGYAANPATQGSGFYVSVTATGAANEGIQQTLNGLKASTTYIVTGRVQPVVGGDSCSLRTTGGSANLATTLAAGTAWATLNGTFTTDATPTAIVLIAEADVDGDICRFDYISVRERNTDSQPLGHATVQAVYDSDDTVAVSPAAFTTVPNLSVAFTPSSPGWVVEVSANLSFSLESGGTGAVTCRLDRNGTNLAGTTHEAYIDDEAAETESFMLALSFVEINPAPGTTLTYTAECIGKGGTRPSYNGSPTGDALDSNLRLIAHPPR